MACGNMGSRHWRRGLFAASIIPAAGVAIVGTMRRERSDMPADLIGLYIAWMVTFGLCVGLYSWGIAKFSTFMLMSFYYSICVAVTLAFLSSLNTIDSKNLHLWVPTCANIGIFMGLGLLEIVFSCLWGYTRAILLRIVEGLATLLGGEEHLRLPTYEGYDTVSLYMTPTYPQSQFQESLATLASFDPGTSDFEESTSEVPIHTDTFESNPWRVQ